MTVAPSIIDYPESPEALLGLREDDLDARLGDRYSIDLACDPGLVPIYKRLGGRRLDAVAWRRPRVLEP